MLSAAVVIDALRVNIHESSFLYLIGLSFIYKLIQNSLKSMRVKYQNMYLTKGGVSILGKNEVLFMTVHKNTKHTPTISY